MDESSRPATAPVNPSWAGPRRSERRWPPKQKQGEEQSGKHTRGCFQIKITRDRNLCARTVSHVLLAKINMSLQSLWRSNLNGAQVSRLVKFLMNSSNILAGKIDFSAKAYRRF
jgi:hypothetical protein